eukprot:1191491-Prorocentrum_minimum.AAC.4
MICSQVGSVVVLNLGRIDPDISWRTGSSISYIWPVGFRSRRLYTSKLDQDKRVWCVAVIMII